jgi:PKD repeat protein
MRKLLLTASLVALALGCKSQTPVGPGAVRITETTTTTSTTTTSTTTTTTIPEPTRAKFEFSPVTPYVLQIVNFTAEGSTPGTGRRIVSYDWDFGDGDMKKGIRTTHDFTPDGIYLVTLTVFDDAGQKASESKPITVRPAPKP